MWSVLLQGEHYSTDIAVVAGKVVWMSHARGETGPQQTFDYWEINVPVGWTGPGKTPEVGYSVVLFDDERCARLSTRATDECLRQMEEAFGVSSITMWYAPGVPFQSVPRPEGGCRVAWINGFNLEKCIKARELFREFVYGLGEKN